MAKDLQHMNKILFKILPTLIIINGVVIAGFATYFLYFQISKSHTRIPIKNEVKNNQSHVLGVGSTSPEFTPKPKSTSTPLRSPEIKPNILVITPTPTSVPTPSSEASETKTIITNYYITQVISTPSATPTSTPTPTPSATPSPAPAPALSVISMEIKTPDTDSNFTIEVEDGINACDLLVKAKTEGKISSLTLDDSYLATFNTLLVTEINGFSNYWVFKVNGESPMGCSLINLKNNDQIVWEFIKGGG